MAGRLVDYTWSQRAWPGVGDIDDCWVISTLQSVHAVAPFYNTPSVRKFREAAGDPDDGVNDGGNVDDIMKALRSLWPELAKLVTPVKGWKQERLDRAMRDDHRIFCAAVMGGKMPKPYTTVPHQVIFEFEPGVGRWATDPLAPPHSRPYRLGGEAMWKAVSAYGNGGAFGVLMPSFEDAFKLHPLYVAPNAGLFTQAQVDALIADARADEARKHVGRITTIKGKVAALAADVADD